MDMYTSVWMLDHDRIKAEWDKKSKIATISVQGDGPGESVMIRCGLRHIEQWRGVIDLLEEALKSEEVPS